MKTGAGSCVQTGKWCLPRAQRAAIWSWTFHSRPGNSVCCLTIGCGIFVQAVETKTVLPCPTVETPHPAPHPGGRSVFCLLKGLGRACEDEEERRVRARPQWQPTVTPGIQRSCLASMLPWLSFALGQIPSPPLLWIPSLLECLWHPFWLVSVLPHPRYWIIVSGNAAPFALGLHMYSGDGPSALLTHLAERSPGRNLSLCLLGQILAHRLEHDPKDSA